MASFSAATSGRLVHGRAAKVVGQIKDMIIRGGFNIDPTEVKELARQHRSVRGVSVVGYPDERYGERACAVIGQLAELVAADLRIEPSLTTTSS